MSLELINPLAFKDMWTTSYLHPVIDSSQDLKKREGYFEDGITTLKFSRKRDTGDARNDVAFTGEKGLFFIFPVKGGRYNAASGKIKKHEQTPTASAQRIFIKPCRNCEWSEVFPLNGAILNGSSLLLVQNVCGQIELSCSKITWILVQLPISLLLVQLLDGTD